MSRIATCLFLSVVLAVPARAESSLAEADGLYSRGIEAYKAAVQADDRTGQKAAAADLERALKLYNVHLDAHPDDLSRYEEKLTEINATLFWHGRMSVPDFGSDEDGKSPEELATDQERRAKERADRREEAAAELLKDARSFADENPGDLYGQRLELRNVRLSYPETTAAREAQMQIAVLDQEIAAAEAAGTARTVKATGEPVPQGVAPEGGLAAAEVAVVPLVEELRAQLDLLKGSTAEQEVRARIQLLFAKRRLIEAAQQGRLALETAKEPGDQGRIDRVLAGLARAVTILDQAVAEVQTRLGEKISIEVIGGGIFAGELRELTWNSAVVSTEQANVHVPFFRFSDGALVELAEARGTADATLAAAAFLALNGNGRGALTQLSKAGEQGAPEEEVAALRLLAGDEKTRAELEKQFKSETARWRSVEKLPEQLTRAFEKKDYLGVLKVLLKADKRPGLTDRDLEWLSWRTRELGSESLGQLIKASRETCSQKHADLGRQVTCAKCNGQGTVLTRSPGGLFGVKPKQPVRVECPTCRGKRQVPCPECWDRFQDKDARALEQRAH